MNPYLKQDLLPRAASLLPIATLHRLASSGVVFPYYHMVTDEPVPHVEHLYRFRSIAEFTADLDFFLQHFQPIKVEDLLSAMEGGNRLPARPFLLSFDDGFREMHDIVAPILQSKGVPAVFFLNSAMHDNQELCFHQKISLIIDAHQRQNDVFPETLVLKALRRIGIQEADCAKALRAISWAQREVLDEIGQLCGCDYGSFLKEYRPYLSSEQVIRMIDEGFEFGGHSIDHPLYAEIEFAEQLRQTRESMAFIRERFAPRRRVFAFPHMDRGVTRAFFDEVVSDGTVELSFGTSAPARDTLPRSFQRFTMEKSTLPARAIFARQALKALRSRAINRN